MIMVEFFYRKKGKVLNFIFIILNLFKFYIKLNIKFYNKEIGSSNIFILKNKDDIKTKYKTTLQK